MKYLGAPTVFSALPGTQTQICSSLPSIFLNQLRLSLSFGLRQTSKEQVSVVLCETYPQEYKGGRVIVPEGTRKGLLKEGECSELWNRGSGIRDIAGQGHCISKAGNDGWH